jgi:hypothetical protein
LSGGISGVTSCTSRPTRAYVFGVVSAVTSPEKNDMQIGDFLSVSFHCGAIATAAVTPEVVANAVVAAVTAEAVVGVTDTAKSAMADAQSKPKISQQGQIRRR